jgi:hypothetical protein
MKIVWAAEDIVPGRIVGNPDHAERWLIGCHDADDNNFALVSLTDGRIRAAATAAVLASSLNAAGLMPVEFFSDPSHVKRGQKGARARAESLSPGRRSEIAVTAANARWKK